MTVFLAHAPADQAAAESLERVIERRGHFAELDDGMTAMRPVQASDIVVLLISKDLVFAPTRLRLEQRALDAWSEGRLISVRLDHGIAPVGLRDLPTIDASVEAQREFKWLEVANKIQEMLRASRRGADAQASNGSEPMLESTPRKLPRRQAGWSLWLCLLLMLPGVCALIAATSIALVNRIGPTPGTFADLLAGIDAFGMRYGAPSGITAPIFAAAIALFVLAPLGLIISRLTARGSRNEVAKTRPDINEDYQTPPAPGAPKSDAVFVSYARANATTVLPVIEAVKQLGRRFWLDQQSIASGDGWAGEIVRAIKTAPGVLVMCSKAAFESDHVKREIYLADRYRRRLVPVFIEEAEPPEDFEYFFAGVQSLNLFETPEEQRPQALMSALGGAA